MQVWKLLPRIPAVALGVALATGCVHRVEAPSAASSPPPIALVPGCPTEPDGHLSMCQWRRALWGARLYAQGAVTTIITSGNAVYTPYRESQALAAGLEALGVPASAILQEPRALHTDENVAYTLRLLAAQAPPADRLLVASDGGQAAGACAMVHAWSALDCVVAPIDEVWMRARMAQGVPDVQAERVGDWVPLAQREAAIAAQLGYRRPSSFWVYTRGAVLGAFGKSRPPPLPP